MKTLYIYICPTFNTNHHSTGTQVTHIALFTMHLKMLFCIVSCTLLIVSPTNCDKRRCGPHFCDNIRVSCLNIECGPNEVALIKPELCRCCPACYPAN